jgi:hypothetical protein
MDVQAGIFTQAELCQVTGLNSVTVDTWLIRGILRTTKVGGRTLRGRRLFSVLAIFEAKVTSELVTRLSLPPSEASEVARCAAADWNTADDWKFGVITAIERSAKFASVFLMIVRTEDGWRTIPFQPTKIEMARHCSSRGQSSEEMVCKIPSAFSTPRICCRQRVCKV